MHLFADISSHGFGHLAISAPVLNALAESTPDLQLTVRSALPAEKLRERIHVPFQLIATASDFGYIMIDATRIDRQRSAAAYRAAHANWAARVSEEANFLAQLAPNLVLSNVSYLPLAGAKLASIPAIGICSLNWADLFRHYFAGESWADPIHAQILSAYHSATKFLRITPGMPMTELDKVQAVGSIAALGKKHALGLAGDKAVMIAMGGIAHRLPIEHWPRLPGIRWLVSRDWQCRHPDTIAWEDFGLNFTDLLCSVDAIVTKPGYGTFTEAACNGTPVLYQRRLDWPEQDCLIEWLHANALAHETSAANLESGDIGEDLQQLWSKNAPPRPKAHGAHEAATIIHAIVAG